MDDRPLEQQKYKVLENTVPQSTPEPSRTVVPEGSAVLESTSVHELQIVLETSAPEELVQNPTQQQEITEIRGSTRVRTQPKKFSSYSLGKLNLAHCLLHTVEPNTYSEAVNNTEKEKWLSAMKEELEYINKSETWELSDLLRENQICP